MSSLLLRTARTRAGATFLVPPTRDMFQSLLTPFSAGPPEYITLFLLLFYLLPLPRFCYLVIFLFWRLSYNLLLGILLHRQSASNALTTYLSTLSPCAHSLLNFFFTRTLPSSYTWERSPHDFNAWLIFRALCTLILTHDGISYFCFALKYNTPFEQSHPLILLCCIPAGILLTALSFWSKARAHDVLGDYAWFWGDFFFLVDAKLVFDGVFKLFPHPMYTVGYAAYYGAALLTRSYTVLLVSLIAHILQLLFLLLVEEPHMAKIYGTQKDANIKGPKDGERDELSQRALFVSVAPQKGLVAVLCVAFGVFSVLCAGIGGATWPVVVAVVCWRAVHWGACACLLQSESKDGDNRWMRLFAERLSRAQAYSCWQHVYLVSYMMNHALFFVLGLRVNVEVGGSWPKCCAHILGGALLIALASVAMLSMWKELGLFGFYYGDFFANEQKSGTAEGGVFRYVSHPEVRLGYLAYYGLAFMKQSWGLFWLTFFCQVVHEIFVYFVEEPDMKIRHHSRRTHTPLENAIKSLPGVEILIKAWSHIASRGGNMVQKFYVLYFARVLKYFEVRCEKSRADMIKSWTKLWENQVMSRATSLKNKVEARVGVLNCERVVSLLESMGAYMRRVS